MTKVAVVTAMQGRHKTVAYCYRKMKHLPIEFLYGYTTKSDEDFITNLVNRGAMYQAPNAPLWQKFQIGIDLLQHMDFDIAIMLGSDDYFDEKFLDYVVKHSKTYDFIGFKDIYFEEKGNTYYWSGYTNHRIGEPCGAGKVYTREALELLNWDLYSNSVDSGLDGHAWKRVNKLGLRCKIASIKHEGLKLVDVKDEASLTKLSKFEKNSLELRQ